MTEATSSLSSSATFLVGDEPSSSPVDSSTKQPTGNETTPGREEATAVQPLQQLLQEEEQDEEVGEEQDVEQKKSSSSSSSVMMKLQATSTTRHAAPSPLGPSEAGGKLPKGGAAGVVEGVGVVVGQYEVARDLLAGQLREVEANLVDQLHRLPPPTSTTVPPPRHYNYYGCNYFFTFIF